MSLPDNATFEVSITSPTANDSRDDGRVDVVIRERLSGEILAAFSMTPGRWWRLNQGATATVRGFLTNRPERLRKVMRVNSVPIGRRWDLDQVAAGKAADAERLELGYETAEARSTNSGWVAILRRWEEPTAADLEGDDE